MMTRAERKQRTADYIEWKKSQGRKWPRVCPMFDAYTDAFRPVRIQRLPADKKQYLFKQMKAKQPALAELLQNDPVIQQLRAQFGAELLMNQAEYKELIED